MERERLVELLDYEPETGLFKWKRRRGRIAPGEIAGTKDSHGYCQIAIDYRTYRAHRLAWLYMHGRLPTGDIDHINGNPLDNRISNLRDVSRSVNLRNRHRAGSHSKVGVVGVSQSRNSFCARIKSPDGEHIFLGVFETKDAASAAYMKARQQFAQLI